MRDAVLAARWQVIERVSLLAARSFTSDSGYWELLDGVVKRHARPGDTVRMSERDTRTQRSRQGVKTGTPLPILGGVVIVSGREQKSFALDEALAAARDSLAGELARALFD
jgi:hypothetical protein